MLFFDHETRSRKGDGKMASEQIRYPYTYEYKEGISSSVGKEEMCDAQTRHDDLHIIDRYIEYDKKDHNKVSYLTYILDKREDEGEWERYVKVVKLCKTYNVPKELREKKALMVSQDEMLSSVWKNDINFLCIYVNMPEEDHVEDESPNAVHGFYYLYGVQCVMKIEDHFYGTGTMPIFYDENTPEAEKIAQTLKVLKEQADAKYGGLINLLRGNFRQAQFRPLEMKEALAIQDTIENAPILQVIRGIPKTHISAASGVTTSLDGVTTTPDGIEQNEEFIRGMLHDKYANVIMAVPIPHSEILQWSDNTARELSKYKSQYSGMISHNAGVSIPMVFAGNLSATLGNTNGTTDTTGDTTGITQGISDSTSHGVGTSDGTSHSVGYSDGQSRGIADSTSQANTNSTSQGLSQSQSLSNSIGTSQTESDGTTHGVTDTESVGRSHTVGQSESYGESETKAVTNSHSLGRSATVGQTSGETFGQTEGITKGHTIGNTHGTSLTSGHTIGNTNGMTMGSTLGRTVGQTFGDTYGTTMGHTVGDTSGHTFGTTQGETTGQTYGTTAGNTYGVTNGLTRGITQGHTIGNTIGNSITDGQTFGSSSSYGGSHTTSDGTSNTVGINRSTGLSQTAGHTLGTTATNSNSASFATGNNWTNSVSGNFTHSGSMAGSQATSRSESGNWTSSYNQGIGHSATASVGADFGIKAKFFSAGGNGSVSGGVSDNASLGESGGGSLGIGSTASSSYTASNSYGGGYSSGVGGSITRSNGNTQSLGVSEANSFSRGLTQSIGQSQSSGITHTASDGNSWSNGTTMSNSHSLGHTTSNSVSDSLSHSLSQSQSLSRSQSLSHSLSNSDSFSLSHSASDSLSHSISNSLSNSHSQSLSNSLSNSLSHSLSRSASQSISDSLSRGITDSISDSRSLSNSLSNSHSLSNSTSLSRGLTEGWSQGYSHGIGRTHSIGNTVSDGITRSLSHGVSDSTSHSISNGVTRSQSVGNSIGRTESLSQGSSTGIGRTANQGLSRSLSDSQGVTQGTSTSDSRSNGKTTSNSNSLSNSQGLSAAKSTALGTGSSMNFSLGPTFGVGRSYQVYDESKGNLIKLLEVSNTRWNLAVRMGAFHVDAYVVSYTAKAAQGIALTSVTSWGGDNEIATIQCVTPGELTQAHLLKHVSVLDPCSMKDNTPNIADNYVWSTIMLTSELAALTHLPRVETGGISTVATNIPPFSVFANKSGEIFFGKQINYEDGEPSYNYYFSKQEFMHTLICGASGSGKTTSAVRMAREVIRNYPDMKIFALDWKNSWRVLKRFAPDPEKDFEFYGLDYSSVRPIRMNLFIPPKHVGLIQWCDKVIESLCLGYGFGNKMYGILKNAARLSMLINGVLVLNENGDPVEIKPQNEEEQALLNQNVAKVTMKQVYEIVQAMKEGSLKDGTSLAANIEGVADSNTRDYIKSKFANKPGMGMMDAFDSVLTKLEGYYAGELKPLYCVDDYEKCLHIEDIIDGKRIVVLEGGDLDGSTKKAIIGLISWGLFLYARLKKNRDKVVDKRFYILEEAHRIIDNPESKSGAPVLDVGENIFEILLNEAREYGVYCMVIVQTPSALPPALVTNCAILIIHRLGNDKDITLMTQMLSRNARLDNRDVPMFLAKMPIGWACIRINNKAMHQESEPALVQVARCPNNPPSNEELILSMPDVDIPNYIIQKMNDDKYLKMCKDDLDAFINGEDNSIDRKARDNYHTYEADVG